MVKFPTLQFHSSNDLKSFVEFWSKFYNKIPDKERYDPFIVKSQFEINDIEELYKWKNGMTLSSRKEESLTKNITFKLDIINSFKLDPNLNAEQFKKEFNHVSLVWQVFLLHIIKPAQFPIYDQHVHRAYNFIHRIEYKSIDFVNLTNKAKEEFYFETYVSFVTKRDDIDLKAFDEAMWTFGKFLNTKWNLLLLS